MCAYAYVRIHVLCAPIEHFLGPRRFSPRTLQGPPMTSQGPPRTPQEPSRTHPKIIKTLPMLTFLGVGRPRNPQELSRSSKDPLRIPRIPQPLPKILKELPNEALWPEGVIEFHIAIWANGPTATSKLSLIHR